MEACWGAKTWWKMGTKKTCFEYKHYNSSTSSNVTTLKMTFTPSPPCPLFLFHLFHLCYSLAHVGPSLLPLSLHLWYRNWPRTEPSHHRLPGELLCCQGLPQKQSTLSRLAFCACWCLSPAATPSTVSSPHPVLYCPGGAPGQPVCQGFPVAGTFSLPHYCIVFRSSARVISTH